MPQLKKEKKLLRKEDHQKNKNKINRDLKSPECFFLRRKGEKKKKKKKLFLFMIFQT